LNEIKFGTTIKTAEALAVKEKSTLNPVMKYHKISV
jgi:hypothetical protein